MRPGGCVDRGVQWLPLPYLKLMMDGKVLSAAVAALLQARLMCHPKPEESMTSTSWSDSSSCLLSQQPFFRGWHVHLSLSCEPISYLFLHPLTKVRFYGWASPSEAGQAHLDAKDSTRTMIVKGELPGQ